MAHLALVRVPGTGREVQLQHEASWVVPEGFRRQVNSGGAILDRDEEVCLVSV